MSQLAEKNASVETDSSNDNTSHSKNTMPVFNFRRMSGLDQATMTTDSDWQNLDQLPQQIWMALSCPIQGLEYDQDTLKMLDTDNDGRIHAQDVKDAVAWVCQRVIHPKKLCESQALVDLDNIRTDTEVGTACANALRLVLKKFPGENNIASLDAIKTVLSEASDYQFNGDGIVSLDFEQNQSAINDYLYKAMAIIGGKKDATGKPGIDQSLADALDTFLKKILAWRKTLNNIKLPLGDKTGEAWTLYCRLKPKFDDYFYRCHLAAFDPSSLASLNIGERTAATADAQNIFPALVDQDTLQKLPLARITETPSLALDDTLNPAWASDVKKFLELTQPISSKTLLTANKLDEKSWLAIKDGFAEYATVLAKKPSLSLPPDDAEKVIINGFPDLVRAPENDKLDRTFLPVQPNITVSELSDSEIETLLSEKTRNELELLIQKDLAAPPLSAFQDLYKLTLFHANLYTFLMNFLSFVDFYDPEKKAIFQEGVLYLDSRACYLCVPVEDVDNHARLAAQSHLCLIYCACERKAADGAVQKANIAAALTLGNVAALIEGRHGLFIDNAGQEWDTRILKVVHNPISLREAVWAPYIRISNMVAEQAHKFLAARDKAIADANEKLVSNISAGAQPKQSFDFAKGAGIFAALSVALSVLSAAFAYIANSVASLGWLWPLALVGIFICISGPSALIAYFKLRRRTLGPLLDASGWAVNQGAPINLAMGMALTSLGKIPPNAAKNLDDPYNLAAQMKKKSHWLAWLIFIIFIVIVLGCVGFGLYCTLIYEPVWVTKARLLIGI